MFQGPTISPVIIVAVMTKSLRIIGRYIAQKGVKLGVSMKPLN